MVFSSLFFLFAFLPSLFLVYYIINKFGNIKLNNIILLVFSLFFLFWGSGQDILILLGMILINYTAGILLTRKKFNLLLPEGERTGYHKAVLIICITLSLGLLGFFKYSGFLAQNAQHLVGLFGLSWTVPSVLSNVLLPLGISFYTFQALSYTLDVYFGNVAATKNFLDFSLFVSFFPQLIAGPIVRYKDIYKQISKRSSSIQSIYEGVMRFIFGLAKKVLLANVVAKAADGIFKLPLSELHLSLAWLGVIAYTLQIFLDFSAYSDMAIGLAKIFGFDLLENFNYPYIAKSMQDFWRRWHISLSTWFRDYLYIPLGGNRKGNIRTYINLLIVFFICGLWHGASWTFVAWGLWNGAFLLIERRFLGSLLKKFPAFIRYIYTMLVVMFGWVIFRSSTILGSLAYIKRMLIPQEFTGQIMRFAP